MSDMECESLLLDEAPGRYSEESDYEEICFADEDALLADDETEFVSNKSRGRSHSKFDKDVHQPTEPDTEDVLDLGTQDTELDEEDALHKKSSNIMTVSSTTPAEHEVNLSTEDVEERETRFKQERQNAMSIKSYANIPDSLDDVVITYPSNNQRKQQKSFRGRARGYYQNNNHQRNKSESKTVLINPHFKGKVTVTNNTKLKWDARQRLNQNHRGQRTNTKSFIQHRQNQDIDVNWNNGSNLQVPQPPPPQFQQFVSQIPQQQIYNQPPVAVQHHQVPQQVIHTYQQPPQQCFVQPLQDSFYSQQPQFVQPPQFSHPPSQFQQVPQFSSDPAQFSQSAPIRMVSYGNPQFIIPQNHIVQSLDPYGQPAFNQSIQPSNPPPVQIFPTHQVDYVEVNKPRNVYRSSFGNRRRGGNNGMRKNKKHNQMVSKNLHEVCTVQQVPDTTVKDDEDEATKEYRRLIEQQKMKREQILQQKEARRRQAAQIEQNASASIPKQSQEIVPVPQQKILPLLTKPLLIPNRIFQKQPVQRVLPLNHSILKNHVRKVTPAIIKQVNPNLKVINISNEPNIDKQHLSSFLSNRKIIAKDESLLDTNIVLISNLAHGTTAVKLRKMCVGIGDVKSLQMSPKERQATIQFNSVASAHEFFKKYQRTMLDLSMIQVTLKPIG